MANTINKIKKLGESMFSKWGTESYVERCLNYDIGEAYKKLKNELDIANTKIKALEIGEIKLHCKWIRAFDGHFNISCVEETGERANGNFKGGKWDFKNCPYCGKIILLKK